MIFRHSISILHVKTSGNTLLNEELKTKSWDEIITLLPKIHIGTSAKHLISILGEPHMREYEDVNAQYNNFRYLERPNDIGMMNYVEFIMDTGLVQDIKLGEISVDPW
jgi:hypothetical protein